MFFSFTEAKRKFNFEPGMRTERFLGLGDKDIPFGNLARIQCAKRGMFLGCADGVSEFLLHFPSINLGMLQMRLPVLRVRGRQIPVADDQQVLGVLLFRRLREVERPGDHCFGVDDHNLVVGNCVPGINHHGNPRPINKICRRIFSGSLALVQDTWTCTPRL